MSLLDLLPSALILLRQGKWETLRKPRLLSLGMKHYLNPIRCIKGGGEYYGKSDWVDEVR